VLSRPDIATAIIESDPATSIVATGSSPESLKDLLAVGSRERHEYLNDISAQLASIAIESSMCDDAIVIDGPKMGIAYYNEAIFLETLSKLTRGELVDPIVKPWSTGPWLPEAFADDLRRAIPIHNANSLCSTTRIFDTYPPILREAICARSMLEISIKSARIDVADRDLSDTILASDICFAGLRYLHAENSIYFRGLRYADETINQLPSTSQKLARSLLESTDNYGLAKTIAG